MFFHARLPFHYYHFFAAAAESPVGGSLMRNFPDYHLPASNMLRVCKTSQQLETEILIVPGHIHPSHRNSLLQYFERPCCEVFTMNRIYTTIFSSELGSAPAQQPGRNSGCCYRSQTVNSFALSSLQSIRLYTREEVAGMQDNAVLSNLSIQYKFTICCRIYKSDYARHLF